MCFRPRGVWQPSPAAPRRGGQKTMVPIYLQLKMVDPRGIAVPHKINGLRWLTAPTTPIGGKGFLKQGQTGDRNRRAKSERRLAWEQKAAPRRPNGENSSGPIMGRTLASCKREVRDEDDFPYPLESKTWTLPERLRTQNLAAPRASRLNQPRRPSYLV